jgi:signal transduction histidine kinase
MDNAFKFTPSGGDIQVELTAAASEAVPEWAVFTVRDTGIGIMEADMGLLFGRFHRGRNTGEYPGSGLGLAIVRQIATIQGGDVTAVRLPTGTEFILRLPLIK